MVLPGLHHDLARPRATHAMECTSMNIIFSDRLPHYDANRLTLTFPATAGELQVECAITAEALEDHFGAASLREADLREAFLAHRDAIERAAARMIDATQSEAITLHSGYFRMYEESDDAVKARSKSGRALDSSQSAQPGKL